MILTDYLSNSATPNFTVEDVLQRCAYSKHYVAIQDFKGAQAVLQPLTDALDEGREIPSDALPDAQLCVGVLIGWLGGANEKKTQERAKNYITRAYEAFRQIPDSNRHAECLLELGICYWREGSFSEARTTLEEALKLTADQLLIARIRSTQALVERFDGQFGTALQIHREVAPLYEAINNNALECKFHSEYAVALQLAGETDKAIDRYTWAAICAERAGNIRHQGFIENNLSFLKYKLGLYDQAHSHLDTARKLFVRIKDQSCIAQVDETRARVLIAEKRYRAAHQLIKGSIATFERTGEGSLLAEALTCSGIALARLCQPGLALIDFERATNMAQNVGAPNEAGKAIITLLEELPGLEIERQRDFYFEADTLLAKSQDAELLERLRACANNLIERAAAQAPPKSNLLNFNSRQRQNDVTLDKAKRELEEWMIERTLEETGCNVSKAARQLGLTPQGLHEKINLSPRLTAFKEAMKNQPREPVEIGACIPCRMPNEAFYRRGVHVNDRIIARVERVSEGDPAVAWLKGGAYAGYYSEYFLNGERRVRLTADAPHLEDWDFAREDIEKIARVIGVIKAEDVQKPHPKIHPV